MINEWNGLEINATKMASYNRVEANKRKWKEMLTKKMRREMKEMNESLMKMV